MDYLKDKQYYIDRHDLKTVEECLSWYWDIKNNFSKHRNNKEFKDYTDEEFENEVDKVLGLMLKAMKEQRFRNKYETIQKWMDEDNLIQDKQDKTPEPKGIKCLECGSGMKMTMKSLHDAYDKNPYILFMYKCVKCNKRRIVKEDGSEWIYEKPKCPKCKGELNTDIKFNKKADITTFTKRCTKCSYKNIDIHDHKKFQKEQEIKEQKNKELLEKYREEFCFSDKEGKEMVDAFDALEFGHEVYEYEKSKYDNPAFEKAATINKIGITEVEKLLGGVLEKEKYIKFSTDKPEIDRFVIVPFNLQDGDTFRNKRNNLSDLEKLIKKTLEGTNWRLLSGSLMSRLGFISGRLKGYEQEEDLLEISGYKKEKEKKKLDPEKLAKYAGNNIVALSRMSGEFAGIECMRKRRLLKEPDGFLLEPSDTYYNCTICGRHSPTGETWWIPNALWCIECKRNIDEGVIPKLVSEDDHKKTWFRQFDIDYYRGIKTPTIRKLEREGLLHPRKLVDRQGWTYCSVYLVKENKEFLEKYPKIKKTSPNVTISGNDGR